MNHIVEPVDDRSLGAFVDLAFDLYRRDPNWVPPLRAAQREMLAVRGPHPFHQHSEVRYFLARTHEGRVCGRIAAIHNRRHNEYHGDRVGFFGFLEAVDDPGVFASLFDAAAAWLRERGLDTMRGPMNFSTNEEIGLLVEGFDGPPVLMMTYNPPWYADRVAGCGFTKSKDVLAYMLNVDTVRRDRLDRIARLVEARKAPEIRYIRRRRLYDDVLVLMDIYNECWKDNWGFVPMTDAEFRQLARDLGMMIIPELVPIVYMDGTAVAFATALPDANMALKKAGGRILPAVLALKVPPFRVRIDTTRVLLMGVRKKYRGLGLESLMIARLISNAEKRGIRRSELSWVLEENTALRGILERDMGVYPYRTYRIYDRPL